MSIKKIINVGTIGRRKKAIARIYLKSGAGKISVNGRELKEYFRRETLEMIIKQPLVLTKTLTKYDIKCNLKGGGLTGQAGALRLAISRALAELEPKLKPILKKEGFLTRDPRMRERKKYGLAGARKKYQFSKR